MFCSQCQAKLPDDAKFCIKCGTRLDDALNQSADGTAHERTRRGVESVNCQSRPKAVLKRRLSFLAGGFLACFVIVIIVVTIGDVLRRSRSRAEWDAIEAVENASLDEVLQKASSDPVYLAELGIRKFNAIFDGKSGQVDEAEMDRIRERMDEAGRILLQAREAVDNEGAKSGTARRMHVQARLWEWWDFVNQFPETSSIYHNDPSFRRKVDGYFGGARSGKSNKGTPRRAAPVMPYVPMPPMDPLLAADMIMKGIPPNLVNTEMGKNLYFDTMEREHQMRVDELESQRYWNAVESRIRTDLSQLQDRRASRMAPQYGPSFFQRTSDGSWVTDSPEKALTTGTDYLPHSAIQRGKRPGCSDNRVRLRLRFMQSCKDL